MAYIDPSQVRPLFTSDVIANYKIGNTPSSLLQSKFKRVSKNTKYIEWNVQRFGETVAQDVVRGGDGNRNQYSDMTRKIEEPPFYYEYMDVMQLAGYDRAFPDNGHIDESAYNDFMATASFELRQMQYKIDRAAEIQAMQIYTTGIVTPSVAAATNYNRRGASMHGYDAAWDWSDHTVDPRIKIAEDCMFIRAYGQSDDAIYDMYIAADAYASLITNPFIQDAEKFHVNVLVTPDVSRRADGSILMRELTAGSFKVRIFTYPQVYTPIGVTDLTGAGKVPYIPNGTYIITPENPMFMRAFSAIPKLPITDSRLSGLMSGAVSSIDGQYFVNEFVDEKATAWFIAIKAASLCIPIAVDQITNRKVLNT